MGVIIQGGNGFIPTGTVTISSTVPVDVSDYATAVVNTQGLSEDNIKKGATILGVSGKSTVVDVNNTTSEAGDVLYGKFFYGSDGIRTQGTIGNFKGNNLNTVEVYDSNYSQESGNLVCHATFPYSMSAVAVDTNTSIKVSNQAVATALHLQSNKIAEGVTICGVSGNYRSTPVLERVNVGPQSMVFESIPGGYFHITCPTTAEGISDVIIEQPYTLIEGNIKAGVNICGVEGNYSPNLEEGNFHEPAFTEEKGFSYITLTPTLNHDGFSSVYISSSDLAPENIKYGKTVLGVTGSYIGGGVALTPGLYHDPAFFDDKGVSALWLNPPTGYDGFEDIKIYSEALTPTNIKFGTVVLGVTGSYRGEDIQNKHVTDSDLNFTVEGEARNRISSATINTSSGYTSMSTVNITSNKFLPENIKAGVEIFGLTGTYGGTLTLQSKTLRDPVFSEDKGYRFIKVEPDYGVDGLTFAEIGTYDLEPRNIKSGVNLFGVEGEYKGDYCPAIACKSNASPNNDYLYGLTHLCPGIESSMIKFSTGSHPYFNVIRNDDDNSLPSCFILYSNCGPNNTIRVTRGSHIYTTIATGEDCRNYRYTPPDDVKTLKFTFSGEAGNYGLIDIYENCVMD